MASASVLALPLTYFISKLYSESFIAHLAIRPTRPLSCVFKNCKLSWAVRIQDIGAHAWVTLFGYSIWLSTYTTFEQPPRTAIPKNNVWFFANPLYKSLHLSTELRMHTLRHVGICECRRCAQREGLVQRLLHRYHPSAWIGVISALQCSQERGQELQASLRGPMSI